MTASRGNTRRAAPTSSASAWRCCSVERDAVWWSFSTSYACTGSSTACTITDACEPPRGLHLDRLTRHLLRRFRSGRLVFRVNCRGVFSSFSVVGYKSRGAPKSSNMARRSCGDAVSFDFSAASFAPGRVMESRTPQSPRPPPGRHIPVPLAHHTVRADLPSSPAAERRRRGVARAGAPLAARCRAHLFAPEHILRHPLLSEARRLQTQTHHDPHATKGGCHECAVSVH
jgi:hypothetical protein